MKNFNWIKIREANLQISFIWKCWYT